MSEGVVNHPGKVESVSAGLMRSLWDELKPFPGRDLAALRMAITCTAMVLVSNTFRLPLQDVLPFLVLFTAKEAKITTAITAVLALSAITVAVGAAILLFKCTGNRPEFRIPGMAVEIFVGMYLFRILSIGPVGFILAFIISVSQSVIDLFPTPEDAVHEFLWVWVAVALSAGCSWLATLILFPVPANRVLQRECVANWQTLAFAMKQLLDDSPAAARGLLRPLAKQGPLRSLKLLQLSVLETASLRPKQAELKRLILGFDKIVKLTFSYAGGLLKSPRPITSAEKGILGHLMESSEFLERELRDGLPPSGIPPGSTDRPRRDSAGLQLAEAESTLQDLTVKNSDAEDSKAAPPHKRSLFVADAFSNPTHVQFALKVTLAGMIGYIFYTASDYFGIHTVYYTPLIIALASTGATMHKGMLRIAGCIIGGGLGLIATIWLIPRFETLGMYLLIIFCLHGLAAWVAFGSERISYIGLQIALAFDLGVLSDYGPAKEIDPIRDRFIGIILGVLIMSTVFSLIWPEDARSIAREKVGACLRFIARLLRLNGSQDSNSRSAQLELEITSKLSEANAYEEQAAFEALLYDTDVTNVSNLKEAVAAVEGVYAAALPWVRERSMSSQAEIGRNAAEIAKALADTLEASAIAIQEPGNPLQHLQPRDRGVQFGLGSVLPHSHTPTPLFEHEDEHEHEDDFDAPGEDLPADHRTIEIKGSNDTEIPVSLRELVAAVSDLRL
jgi:multidrug resistance protein MdtO